MRSAQPTAYHVRIDRLVIDGPALGVADGRRFEQELSGEFSRLAQARPAPVRRGPDRVADLAHHVARELFDTLKGGAP